MVFTVKNDFWEELIGRALLQCKEWHEDRNNGQCCWLPLYRSLEDKRRAKFLDDAESALSWIGTTTSLPAARLDSWGLVTLGFADGGTLRIVQDRSGTGYRATFEAEHFTLVIRQESLNTTSVAHITPHQHPLPKPGISEGAWKTLYRTGSSVDRHDDLIAWIGNQPIRPPPKLVDGSWDNKIGKAIFDYQFTKNMKKKLRCAIFNCYDAWEASLHSYPNDPFLTRHARPIMKNLRKFKVFVDGSWSDYCQEITSEEDILHYSEKQLEIVGSHPSANAGFEVDKLKLAFEQHKIILALQKLLLLSVRIPEQLSTKGTGEMLLLAGPVEL
ncbi:hypothetical protein Asppvi_011097 [Aspergillus pseudoviridinutans]|uniref:Uncharacterized protein n=1 Tax=Aspergillus pseudoviridinutans TaxID=1517512 RepID=A0A9P3BR11_9EURO|nr:uncharacterized protein Asppvi_011097 [Aspergillus pseudoviridinutans]GIJ92121.1 hypothetical protein Asppvi_011097 [Aspergillus pseudoviridinutans]